MRNVIQNTLICWATLALAFFAGYGLVSVLGGHLERAAQYHQAGTQREAIKHLEEARDKELQRLQRLPTPGGKL